MRYQVKEALEHVSNVTKISPNSLTVSHIEPNYVHVTCTDDSNMEHKFLYSNGEVLMWDEIEFSWVEVQLDIADLHC